jgi:hypothetical protein
MFTPSQADVRRFFCSVYHKNRASQPMEAIQTLASQWIDEHPEYHADLSDGEAALEKMYDIESGKTNPFLHLSMHLSISEQCSIDQPRGIRQAVARCAPRGDGLPRPDGLGKPALGAATRWRCVYRLCATQGNQRLGFSWLHELLAEAKKPLT